MTSETQEIQYEIDGGDVKGGRRGQTWLIIYTVPAHLDSALFYGNESLAEDYDPSPRYKIFAEQEA